MPNKRNLVRNEQSEKKSEMSAIFLKIDKLICLN